MFQSSRALAGQAALVLAWAIAADYRSIPPISDFYVARGSISVFYADPDSSQHLKPADFRRGTSHRLLLPYSIFMADVAPWRHFRPLPGFTCFLIHVRADDMVVAAYRSTWLTDVDAWREPSFMPTAGSTSTRCRFDRCTGSGWLYRLLVSTPWPNCCSEISS